jgi:hypothetical protein
MSDNKNIGTSRRELNKIFRQFGLTPLRKILTSREFKQASQETIPWKTRERVFTPEVVFWLMALVGFCYDSMASTLRRSWEHMRPVSGHLPLLPASQEAFTQARRKLPLQFFNKLSDLVIKYFRQHYEQSQISWKGFQLKIVDGTTINLPESKELRKAFGSRKNQSHKNSAPIQAHLIGLFWAFAGICQGYAVGSLRLGEKTGLIKLLPLLTPADLLLADRGFPGYDICCQIMNRNIQFLFRLKKDVKPISRKKIGPRDWLAVFKLPKNCRGKGLPETITLRLISYDLPGHRTSYLLTTLIDDKIYSRDELVGLYLQRWQIETRYNELKNMLELENLRSLTTLGIFKEISVRITWANLVRLVMLEAGASEGLHGTDLSYKKTLEKVADTIIIMVNSLVYSWPFIYQRMLEEIRQFKIIKRPGRYYPRHKKRKAGLPQGKLLVEVSYADIS